MDIKKLFFFIALLASYNLFSQLLMPPFPRPCGIYGLGTFNGNTSEVKNYGFVDGFVIRREWATTFETAQNVYNWTYLDAIVKKLDSLGQGLTLQLFRMKVPSYVLSTPGAETYSLTVGPSSFTTSLPWDSIANKRFDILLDSLSNHKIFSIASGTPVAFKDHPVLKQIDASPIGMNGIRDIFNQLTPLASYTRTKFVNSIIRTAKSVRTRFPNKFSFIAIFGINDGTPTPALTQVIRDSIMKVFNRTYPPRMGFFQENLACSTPVGSANNTLFTYKDSTFTMNQMLQGWMNPNVNANATNSCLTTNGGPDIGILYGLNTFKSTYCEIYNVDLDHANFNAAFSSANDSLVKYCSMTTTSLNKNSFNEGIQLFPVPAERELTIATERLYDITIRDQVGRKLKEVKQNDVSYKLNISDLDAGIYFLEFNFKGIVETKKIIVTK